MDGYQRAYNSTGNVLCLAFGSVLCIVAAFVGVWVALQSFLAGALFLLAAIVLAAVLTPRWVRTAMWRHRRTPEGLHLRTQGRTLQASWADIAKGERQRWPIGSAWRIVVPTESGPLHIYDDSNDYQEFDALVTNREVHFRFFL